MNIKRFILALIGVPLLLIAAGAVYYFVTASLHISPSTKNTPQVTIGKLVPVASEPVLSPALSFTGETIWFMTPAGKLYRKNIDGTQDKQEFPLPQAVSNPVRVLWPQNQQDFLVEENLSGHSHYLFYNAGANAFVSYADAMRWPRFLSQGDKIVYDWVTGGIQHTLKVADSDGTNFVKVADLFRGDSQFEPSPRRQEVALYSPDSANPGKLYLVDLFTGQFRNLGQDGAYEGVKFSPDGNKLLLARQASGSTEPHLYWLDLGLSKVTDLGLSALIERTVWGADSKTVFVGTASGIEKYSLDGGKSEEAYKFADTEPVLPRDLVLHPQKSMLFFVDEKTGYLYRLDL